MKVDDMIIVARQEVERAKRYLRNGEYELYKETLKRVDGMVSIITITAIKETDNWDEEWEKIHDRVHC